MCRFAVAVCLVAGATTLRATSPLAANLRGVDFVTVFVSVNDAAESLGISNEALKTSVELQLRDHGLVVGETKNENGVITPPTGVERRYPNAQLRARAALNAVYDANRLVVVVGASPAGNQVPWATDVTLGQLVVFPRELRFLPKENTVVPPASDLKKYAAFMAVPFGVETRTAITWTESRAGESPRSTANTNIRRAIVESMDNFINDYLSENPR